MGPLHLFSIFVTLAQALTFAQPRLCLCRGRCGGVRADAARDDDVRVQQRPPPHLVARVGPRARVVVAAQAQRPGVDNVLVAVRRADAACSGDGNREGSGAHQPKGDKREGGGQVKVKRRTKPAPVERKKKEKKPRRKNRRKAREKKEDVEALKRLELALLSHSNGRP